VLKLSFIKLLDTHSISTKYSPSKILADFFRFLLFRYTKFIGLQPIIFWSHQLPYRAILNQYPSKRSSYYYKQKKSLKLTLSPFKNSTSANG